MKTLTAVFLLVSCTAFAKPVRYNIPDLFGTAKFVGEAVITGYNGEGLIYFRSTQFKDTIGEAGCGQKVKNGNIFNNPGEDYWTCNMPFIGDTVLVVIDGYNMAPVFGKKLGGRYRLWSTRFSGSIALFDFEEPVKPVSSEKTLAVNNGITACWDGCLVPVEQLSTLVQTYRERFSKKVNAVNIKKMKGQEALYIFYDDTLRQFSDLRWTDEPPGKMHSLVLIYSNKKELEIIPFSDGRTPLQFDEHRMFDMEKFKLMKIKELKWVHE